MNAYIKKKLDSECVEFSIVLDT